jgi:catechol 2,3-dioxygenase-like lactoylglutathione lyase family enzyme
MDITLVSSVLFVRDIQASRRFYEEVLGQQVLMDHGLNVGFKGGFALWQVDHAAETLFGAPYEGDLGEKNMELYFESSQLEAVCERLETAGVVFVHPLREQPWGQRVIRFYDPDRHILEIGEPMPAVIARFLSQGMTAEEIAQRTYMPVGVVRQFSLTS